MTEKELRKKAISEVYQQLGGTSFGDVVVWAAPRVKYSMEQDIFGVFDLVCITPANNAIIFIQFTTVKHFSEHKQKIVLWLNKHNIYDFPCWLWGYNELKGYWKKEVVSIPEIRES
jgi:hypothetical protein